jgi:dienelactone hydrolase
MNTPEWLKPGIYGAAVGAVALAIVGFSWGGWVTGGTAEKLASDQAKLEVVAALVPICLEQSSQDPQVDAGFKRSQSQRRESVHGEAGGPVLIVRAEWN